MKSYKLLFICVVLFSSCYFNATRTNEKSEKEKGQVLAEKLYDYIEDAKFNNSIKPYLSSGMLENTSTDELNQIFKKIQSQNGSFERKKLLDWSTKRGKDENGPVWECVLLYEVDYANVTLNETYPSVQLQV